MKTRPRRTDRAPGSAPGRRPPFARASLTAPAILLAPPCLPTLPLPRRAPPRISLHMSQTTGRVSERKRGRGVHIISCTTKSKLQRWSTIQHCPDFSHIDRIGVRSTIVLFMGRTTNIYIKPPSNKHTNGENLCFETSRSLCSQSSEGITSFDRWWRNDGDVYSWMKRIEPRPRPRLPRPPEPHAPLPPCPSMPSPVFFQVQNTTASTMQFHS